MATKTVNNMLKYIDSIVLRDRLLSGDIYNLNSSTCPPQRRFTIDLEEEESPGKFTSSSGDESEIEAAATPRLVWVPRVAAAAE
jgi:hypothetical protein